MKFLKLTLCVFSLSVLMLCCKKTETSTANELLKTNEPAAIASRLTVANTALPAVYVAGIDVNKFGHCSKKIWI
jgi:hypothetical protein